MRLYITLLGLLTMVACSGPSLNKFSDPVIVKIYDLKDHRQTDSLLNFLRSDNVIYRKEVALAFGSVQDTVACPMLGSVLLEDSDSEVRRNAAFALGQTGGFQAVNALLAALADTSRTVSREVLEALGKTISKNDLGSLCAFTSADTLLQEGQSWAFYQLALRKKTDSVVTKLVSAFLIPPHSYQTRLAAAHYFGRSPQVEGKGYESNLAQAALHDSHAEVRMAATNGLRTVPSQQSLPVVKEILKTEKDYRVRVNAVRVIQNFKWSEMNGILFDALYDSFEPVSIAASEVIRNKAEETSSKMISTNLQEVKSDRAKANLYAALVKTLPADATLQEIITLYPKGSSYFKAALLSAMGETIRPLDKQAFEFLSRELLKNTNEKVILTSAANALVSLNRKEKSSMTTLEFLLAYKEAIAAGDLAVIGVVAHALINPSFKKEIKDLQFLYDAKARLQLPRDIESLQPLELAIAYLEGKEEPSPLKNQFNHPIDWKLVKTISAGQLVEITTGRGSIKLRLLVEESPGSVLNFIELLNKKYFDGKFVHRMVPNFVIQTGCNRGDGYGSENYSIRSEFSLRRYTTGSVGMASAGKDTEGTQWFITHCPTPHLDGKYTIFAQVISGMDVVNNIDVGDMIIEAKLKDK